ncbi:receptor-like protein EIX2 [Arachis duranensis]|uniref:Receptor-like protein EIX2 n=1 Tax=Arachis duranensis TaxID=130453 RepID=A0A6P4B9C1_ARADU|nr:receptor-like protein EIX2 [Arachis duranensis]
MFNSSSLVTSNSMMVHCDEKDESILLKFKHEVTDPSDVLSSWSSDEEKDCCQWRGVHCDNITHRVTKLHLPCDTIQSDEILDQDNEKQHCLTGQIPQSMSGMSFLEVLNLSCNNFEGKIPLGTQLEGFTNLSYAGNPKLCGPPLTKLCPQDEKLPNEKQKREDDDDDSSEVCSWFFMGLGIGFATSIWGVLGAILFNRKFRHGYFRFLNIFYDILIRKLKPIS